MTLEKKLLIKVNFYILKKFIYIIIFLTNNPMHFKNKILYIQSINIL